MAIIASLIIAIVGLVLAELLRPTPKIEDERPRGLGDFNFPTATEDRFQPILWGTAQLEAPNVVWWGDFLVQPISKFFKSNIFGGGKRAIIAFRYYVGIQGVLCRGLDSISGFWIGDTRVSSTLITPDGNSYGSEQMTQPDLFGGDGGAGGIDILMDYYFGGPTQQASAYLARFQAVGGDVAKQPHRRGVAYFVARRPYEAVYIDGVLQPFPPGGAWVGNSVSLRPWKFEGSRWPALFSGQSAGQNRIGPFDANPINVIFEILTNREWAMQELSAEVDIGPGSTFLAAANTMIAESNGFSFLLTRAMPLGDLLQEIERQIDGKVYLDLRTGKWKIALARADYDVDTIPELTVDNISEVKDYAQSTWRGTANNIIVKFHNRANNYQKTSARAHDPANMLMQGGNSLTTLKIVSAPREYPACMTASLANQLAWRDCRAESAPRVRATFVVNRAMWDLHVFSVVAWTDAKLGYSRLPMRVLRIDWGKTTKNAMTLVCEQDVYTYALPSFADPTPSEWEAPNYELFAYPAADQLAMEAPRAFYDAAASSGVVSGSVSGTSIGSPRSGRFAVAARQQGPETGYRPTYRSAAGTPSGAFVAATDVYSFMRVGTLQNAMSLGVTNPTGSVIVLPNPDSQQSILDAFVDTTIEVVGTSLVNLIMIDDEFMLVESVQASGLNVQLNGVYRGALDSAQRTHAAGAKVYIISAGTDLVDALILDAYNADVQLRMVRGSSVFAGGAITMSFTMTHRAWRPHAPAAILLNGSSSPWNGPSLEALGSGLNGFRYDVRWWRRNYPIVDEIEALLADEDPDITTEYQLTVVADPAGAAITVGTPSAWAAGAGPVAVLRSDILTAAPAGTRLRFQLRARHAIIDGPALESRQDTWHEIVPSSLLTGLFYLNGASTVGLAVNVASASYTAAATGTFTLEIGGAQTTANIQVSINGGAFSTVIAPTNTSGTFSATSGDTIRVRRTVSESPNPNFVQLKNPSSAVVAYGTFKA